MLKKILKPESCGECRICCVFDRDDIWEIPCVDGALKARIERARGAEVSFSERGENEFVFDMTYGEDGLAQCPMLGLAGCALGEDKPFCCKIWPFRVMRTERGIALTLSQLCTAVNSLGDTKIKSFVSDGFADTVFDYAKAHPDIIKPFHDGYGIIEERLLPPKTCCFTGHRPDKFPFGSDEKGEEFISFRASLKKAVEQAVSGGCVRFMTGMAEGFDLWAAETVLEMKKKYPLSLCAVIPYANHGRSISERYRERYDNIIANADEVICCCDKYSRDCFRKRNMRLVDESETVIAAYVSGNSRSGTAQTLRYAREKGRKIILV